MILNKTTTKILFLLALTFFSIGFLLPHSASASTIKAPIINLGLVGHWTFDGGNTNWTSETVGTVTDIGSGGNDGTFTNMNRLTAAVRGVVGQGITTNGSNSYVEFNNPADFQFTNTDSFSYSLWVRPNTTPGSSTYLGVFGDNDGTNDGWGVFEVNYAGVCTHCFEACYFSIGEYTCRYSADNSANSGQWVHIVVTNDGNNTLAGRQMYVNGEIVSGSRCGASSPICEVVDSIDYTDNNLQIGQRDGTGGAYWSGTTDDVRVYNRAITQSEITRLYNIGRPTTVGATQSAGSLSSGLVGHWTFDGKHTVWTSATEGTVTDSSSGGNDGTLTSMVQSTSPARGVIGQALNFDGTADYVSMPLNLNSLSAVSVSAWVKSDVADITTSDGTIFSNFQLTDTLQLGITSAEKFFFNVYNTSAQQSSAQADSASNVTEWHHVIGVYDGANIYIYVDGVSADSTPGSLTPPTRNGGTTYRIGSGGQSGTTYFDGDIDDVRVYSRVLTQAEITRLYNMGTPAHVNVSQSNGSLSSGLVGHWTFDGGDTDWTTDSTGTLSDVSGSGYDGTILGSTQKVFPTRGVIGQAGNFDGVNDYVINASQISAVTANSDYSVSAWIKYSETTTGSYFIASQVISSSDRFTFTVEGTAAAGSFIHFAHYNGTSYNGTRANPKPADTWHHVVAVNRSSGTVHDLYVDGVLSNDSTGGGGTNPGSSAANFRVGQAGTGGPFLGQIDDVRVYNQALTQAEITRLYNMGN